MSLRRMMQAVGVTLIPGFTGGPYQVFDHRNFPTDALAGIEIDADGAVEAFKSTGNQGDIGRWDGGLTLSKIDFQFRYDLSAGSAPNSPGSAAVDVWLAASASLDFWGQLETGFGVTFSNGTVRMRLDAAPFTEFNSTTLFLEADTT